MMSYSVTDWYYVIVGENPTITIPLSGSDERGSRVLRTAADSNRPDERTWNVQERPCDRGIHGPPATNRELTAPQQCTSVVLHCQQEHTPRHKHMKHSLKECTIRSHDPCRFINFVIMISLQSNVNC